jgi:hypothetical protein
MASPYPVGKSWIAGAEFFEAGLCVAGPMVPGSETQATSAKLFVAGLCEAGPMVPGSETQASLVRGICESLVTR